MDVVVLCSECHKKFHGINENNKTICMPVKKGNYTGGKASYVMVMQKAVESLTVRYENWKKKQKLKYPKKYSKDLLLDRTRLMIHIVLNGVGP